MPPPTRMLEDITDIPERDSLTGWNRGGGVKTLFLRSRRHRCTRRFSPRGLDFTQSVNKQPLAQVSKPNRVFNMLTVTQHTDGLGIDSSRTRPVFPTRFGAIQTPPRFKPIRL